MSPSLTLISHPLCPFVQRAAIVLLENAAAFERIDVDLSAKPDWFLALSPTGKVPLLRIGQPGGSVATVFESVVICDYLNDTSGKPSLYPNDPLQRAQQRAWIEFATPTFADGWQLLIASDQASAETARAAFRGKLQKIEDVLGEGPYFAGSAFGMVDVVFAPLLRYFDLLQADISAPIFDGLPRVREWRAALAARQSVISAVGPDYASRFQQHLQRQRALLADAVRVPGDPANANAQG
ncbi:glutathione S-transferase family protein [Xanthomonas vesicatoria]|uniref:glutathione transferase n=1 Tax=Xanthomonas vesicatoria TaxID=56460 RepID=A0AAJ0IZ39_9XANT|nr:glutathione S-transferase family protein [Xanthomonas vesicatoria]APO95860.1 glutathione S-transferase [Xanthomonas vesicatoria]KHM94850.1 glutathione S-transferase [Xanthomonas vesicatoria]KHM96615.1 glutathione S-transferase [Xanthomonas vesicatoria]MCC8623673.1 glutathione S-transferase family protein [Xanthomonas vesicatoria]MCC8695230.1 glutathione S-transferase family protein [Xanthomonas vesicatoria]